jgi:ankyrin repeat protein
MDEYLRRSRGFQETTARYLAAKLGVALNHPSKWPTSSMLDKGDASHDDYVSVLCWFESSNLDARAKAHDIGLYGHAFELAISYLLGLGVVSSEHLALDALSYAAQGAISLAMAMFPSIAASCHPTSRDRSADHEAVWLSYGMRNGCHETYDRARLVLPQLYRTTRRIMMARILFLPQMNSLTLGLDFPPDEFLKYLWNDSRPQNDSISDSEVFEQICNPGIRPLHAAAGLAHLPALQQLISDAPAEIHVQDQLGRPPIWYAVEAGDPDCTEFLLQHGADANFVDATSQSLLHKASFHDDTTAAKIASTLLQHEASLEPFALEKSSIRQSPYLQATGQPLTWAIFKNRPKLFAMLLKAHYENDVPIAVQTWLLMMETIGIYTHCEMFEELWKFRLSSPNNVNPLNILKDSSSLLLRWAVRKPSYHTIGCRWLLGAEYYPQQAKFLRSVLHLLDTDPLQDSIPGAPPLAYAFRSGDRQAVEVFFEHLEGKGVDILKLLADGWDDHNAGVWSLIHAKCSDALVYVLERFPSLVYADFHRDGNLRLDLKQWSHSGEVSKPHGRLGRTLHYAAICGGLSAVQALLDAGADIYNRDNIMDVTALELALDQGRIDVAETIIKGANEARLFGQPSETGNTVFGRLVNRKYTIRRRVPLETFQFLKKHNGLDFIINVKQGFSVWFGFFSKKFVSRRDLIEEDLRLLEFLLESDVFLDKIHDLDSTGMAAIHYACRYGNYESVKLLLHKGAFINQETHESNNFLIITPRTATPIEMFARTITTPPKSVLAGGQEEMKLWRDDRRALTKLLSDHGAKRGSCSMSLDKVFEEMGVFDAAAGLTGRLASGEYFSKWRILSCDI